MDRKYDMHSSLMNVYKQSKHKVSKILNEDDIILNNFHEFVRDDDKDEENKQDWRIRMARKYYDKLYKEYAIVDLSRYMQNQIGMRWRIENEVIEGKGQFICGSKHCSNIVDLHSYELPFNYNEQNVDKYELVKVRVCLDCARKLFYNKVKELKKIYKKRKLNDEVIPDNAIDIENIKSHNDMINFLNKFEKDINRAESKDNRSVTVSNNDDDFYDELLM